jgi:glucose-6-phosphate isomerase
MPLSKAGQISFDPKNFEIDGVGHTERRLSDLEGFFADDKAYKRATKKDNPVIYRVQSVTPADGKGDLHYGLGTLMPGKIGQEYYLTKGHFHGWREAAEVYIGLEGTGGMLLEEEKRGESKILPLKKNSIVYVPGHTAHRTVNFGNIPLKYIGVYPAGAGHDYGAIADRNFHSVVVEIENEPQMIERKTFLKEFV